MPRNTSSIPAATLLGLALGLAASAIPAEAQSPYYPLYSNELDLGSPLDSTLSGTATLTNSATSSYSAAIASGTYSYFPTSSNQTAPLTPTSLISSFYTYGASTADVTGGTLLNITSYDDSQIQYSGGTVVPGLDGMQTTDNSSITVTGGDIDSILSRGTSTFTLGGGTIENGVYAQGDSTADITGGSVLGDGDTTAMVVGSTANVSGGLIDGIGTEFNGVTNISGGTITGPGIIASNQGVVNIIGGSFTLLSTYNQTTINIFGNDFLETPLGPSGSGYQVTGTLEDGQKLSTTYSGSGSLVFHDVAPVPEASTTVSLGLLLALGLSGLILKKHRACPEGRKTRRLADNLTA